MLCLTGSLSPSASFSRTASFSVVMMILAAFLGAMICMGFVLLMARRVNRMSMLVVSGVMIGYICSAITEFVVTFAEDAEIVNLHNWSRGSFSGMNWNQVSVMSNAASVRGIRISHRILAFNTSCPRMEERISLNGMATVPIQTFRIRNRTIPAVSKRNAVITLNVRLCCI